jgi:hypothetical protein
MTYLPAFPRPRSLVRSTIVANGQSLRHSIHREAAAMWDFRIAPDTNPARSLLKKRALRMAKRGRRAYIGAWSQGFIPTRSILSM